VLRSFRVANHRSIRDEQELLLMPAYDKHRAVVPVAAIFGANASGKSNLLNAMRFMQTAVRASYAEWEPGGGIPRQPFRLVPGRADDPSVYVVDLNLADVRHVYGFVIDDDQIREEWLFSYPHGRRRTLFQRDENGIRLGSTLPDYRSRTETLAGLTRKNILFLSAAAHANQQEVLPVYDWFRGGFSTPSDGKSNSWVHALVRRLQESGAEKRAMVELIQLADLGISDVVVEENFIPFSLPRLVEGGNDETVVDLIRSLEEPTQELFLEDFRRQLTRLSMALTRGRSHLRFEAYAIRFEQGQNGQYLGLDDQSEGTRAWMSLLVDVLEALDKGSLLIIDEIDTSLHPRLTARLIELFQDTRTNPRSAQLVFATHDASLLGTSFGREVLARDQIWFVEKDADGATALFPLTDFHPRKEENTERRYLGGSYGAVPAVFSDSLVDGYLAARREPLDDSA
jgi:uncharacterized protein